MTYEEAKLYKQQIEDKNNVDSKRLKAFEEKYGVTVLGTVSDKVRELPEWKQAKQEFDKSFSELRNFNGWFVKQFKKEYAAERRNRFKKAQ